MTAIFNEATINTILSATFNAFSFTYGLPMIALLVALLTGKELVRSVGGAQTKKLMGMFDIAIVPLMLAFGCVIILRLLYLLGNL